jgi:large subunit ribosomal protein L23
MTTKNKVNSPSQNWQDFIQTSSTLTINAQGQSAYMNNMIDLIKYPVITEKSYLTLFKNQQYTFDVDLRLSKPQIKKLFENLFNVNVIAVNTHIPPRKNLRVGATKGNRARYKRAILTLKKGQSLKFTIPLTF